MRKASKSTVNAELKARGYESYDGDEDNIAEWFDEQRRIVKVEKKDIDQEFLDHHFKGIDRKVIEDLNSKAKSKPIFLCNDPENEEELVDLFDQVFALMIDEETERYRLAKEIEYSLAFKEKWLPLVKKYGYTTIDATLPTKDIVDQILSEIGPHASL